MRWKGRRQSSNIRISRGASALGGGGLVVAIIYFLLSGDPSAVLHEVTTSSSRTPLSPEQSSREQEFAAVVLADTEDVWNAVFRDDGSTASRYREPKLVLFSGQVSSACGTASSAVGPFYCPGDQQIYLDLGFFRELEQKLGAAGDFARAYVIAHEVGHHVQNLLGLTEQVRAADERLGRRNNELSVRLELQADCFAGFWAREADRAKHILEAGDIAEAVGAAEAVGDDRLQQQSQGHVVPDSFTHGTSAQRVAWFKKGLGTAELEDCDTFGVAH